MFKVRRQRRYNKLISSGFLAFEAYTLSKVKSRVPYLSRLIGTRKRLFKKAVKDGLHKTEYVNKIKGLYAKNNWLVPTTSMKKRKGASDPWAMLRDWEEKHPTPDYKSPSKKKKGRNKDFDNGKAKVHRERKSRIIGTEKYPRGGHY